MRYTMMTCRCIYNRWRVRSSSRITRGRRKSNMTRSRRRNWSRVRISIYRILKSIIHRQRTRTTMSSKNTKQTPSFLLLFTLLTSFLITTSMSFRTPIFTLTTTCSPHTNTQSPTPPFTSFPTSYFSIFNSIFMSLSFRCVKRIYKYIFSSKIFPYTRASRTICIIIIFMCISLRLRLRLRLRGIPRIRRILLMRRINRVSTPSGRLIRMLRMMQVMSMRGCML